MPPLSEIAIAFARQRQLEHSEVIRSRLRVQGSKLFPSQHQGYTSNGDAVAVSSNGQRLRTRLLTNAGLGVGDPVEVSRPAGSRLGFADARNR